MPRESWRRGRGFPVSRRTSVCTRRKARQGSVPRDAVAARQAAYQLSDVVDAPEHYEYARAMGLLTWGTWDAEARPVEDRLKDFAQAYPAESPNCFQGSMLAARSDGEYGPAAEGARSDRLARRDGSFGTLPEILARYGLKLRSDSEYRPQAVDVRPFRETAQIRNQRLRMLHGGVDVEAENMDAAKAAEIDRLEKKHAAEQIRAARDQMEADARAEKEKEGGSR